MEYDNKYVSDVLNNLTCPYCGKAITSENKTKDHVIGRKFVPKGALDKEYNLILNACVDCNNLKSDLEDDISAITQLNNISAHEDRETILRKAKGSISRFSKKNVIDSFEKNEINTRFSSSVKMSFSLISGPQINTNRANALALMHLQAFYYLQSYNAKNKVGYFIPNPFVSVLNTVKSDWGNTVNIQFMEIIKNWEIRLNCITAKENFKLNTRKKEKFDCWSWALEWNQYYRLIGFFGNEEVIRDVAKEIVFPKPLSIMQNDESIIRTYKETTIIPEQDNLFIFP